MTDSINIVYSSEIEWPDVEERTYSYNLFSIDSKAIAIVDGTHVQIRSPSSSSESDSLFSGYKNCHSQNFLVYCNSLGFILRIEGPFPGSHNDIQCFNQSDILVNKNKYLSEEELIIGDGGFAGDGPFIKPFRVTEIKKEETIEAIEFGIDYNNIIQDNRALIEHTIHLIKDRARALAGRYCRRKDRQANLFIASAKLVNRTKRLRFSYILSDS